MKLSFAIAAFALLVPIAAHATDPQAVLAIPRQAVQQADYRASGHLVRVDADNKRTSYDISLKAHWFPGVLRILIAVTGPAEARENLLLEMHPSGQSTIRIAHPGDKTATLLPVEKWSDGPLGPGFSYEDFLEQQYFWSGQSALPAGHRGARFCDVIKSTPGPTDRSQYSDVVSWLDHTIGFPIYVAKTPKSGGKIKEFTYFGLRHEGKMWSASQIEEKSDGQPGSTLLIINRGSPKANLTLGDFSPERLLRF
jgi:hypothetical protein